MNAKELSAKLSQMQAVIETHAAIALAEGAELIKHDAQERIGHYQQDWQPLAEETLRDKERLGYAPPDNPLLRSGELRESIEIRHAGLVAYIGSDSEVAEAQEHGNPLKNLPPRPFIIPAAHAKAAEAVELIEKSIAQVLSNLFRG